MEQHFNESSMEQHSNRHLFKLQPGLPCWTILTFFSKLETVPSVHNNEHKFSPTKTLLSQDQFEFFMDRLCYQIILLHFETLWSLYITAYCIRTIAHWSLTSSLLSFHLDWHVTVPLKWLACIPLRTRAYYYLPNISNVHFLECAWFYYRY